MNLFEKYGGADFWSEFLNVFYSRITESALVRHHFRNKNIAHIKEMLLGLLEVTLVSYSQFSETAMRESHRNLGITEDEFEEWINTYKQTLKDSGVTESDCLYIMETIYSYKKVIVSNSY